mgnify:CR=1 FL=1
MCVVMKTEINGNWLDYAKRCRFPGKKAFLYPLKHTAVLFGIQLVVSGVFAFLPLKPVVRLVPVFFVLFLALSYYIKVHWHTFWNVVLEDSKGLLPDLIMWLYYVVICLISIVPSLAALAYIMS